MGPHDSQTYDVPVGLAIEFRIGSMEYYLKIGIYIVGIGLLRVADPGEGGKSSRTPNTSSQSGVAPPRSPSRLLQHGLITYLGTLA